MQDPIQEEPVPAPDFVNRLVGDVPDDLERAVCEAMDRAERRKRSP